jgi:hypothetical protein
MEGPRTRLAPCPGPLRRREFLRFGLAALTGLPWPDLLRRRAAAAPQGAAEATALLVV